jgi:hypothetical protein
MCAWFSDLLDKNARFTKDTVLFSDISYVNGEVNKQNMRYWSQDNPHWISPTKQQGAAKVMVWYGMACGKHMSWNRLSLKVT